MGVEEHRNEHTWKGDRTTTMMTNLFPDLGKPVIKSIELSLQIVGGIGSGCSVLGDLIVSPLLH
jgi:hypothetical protein